MEKSKVNNEDLIKSFGGGINITINLSTPVAAQEEKMKMHHTKKLETVNAEMLKIMKKEKEPIFEQGKELKAEKYI